MGQLVVIDYIATIEKPKTAILTLPSFRERSASVSGSGSKQKVISASAAHDADQGPNIYKDTKP